MWFLAKKLILQFPLQNLLLRVHGLWILLFNCIWRWWGLLKRGCCSGWYCLPIFDLYHEEEPKDDLNEEYQDGNCGAESFDIQPMMTTQGDEIAYFKVVENYEKLMFQMMIKAWLKDSNAYLLMMMMMIPFFCSNTKGRWFYGT